jgi:5'-nucleotidase
MVISGINYGANMGDDTIYSGTVAAATEGFLLGIPSIAVSLAGRSGRHFETAAHVIADLVLRHNKLTSDPWLLNVNVPDLTRDQLKGERVTRLGKRHKAEPVIKTETPRGDTCYWVGAAGAAADAGPGTDFDAVEQGFVSITPLQIDLTNHGQMARGKEWLAA